MQNRLTKELTDLQGNPLHGVTVTSDAANRLLYFININLGGLQSSKDQMALLTTKASSTWPLNSLKTTHSRLPNLSSKPKYSTQISMRMAHFVRT